MIDMGDDSRPILYAQVGFFTVYGLSVGNATAQNDKPPSHRLFSPRVVDTVHTFGWSLTYGRRVMCCSHQRSFWRSIFLGKAAACDKILLC